MKQRGRGRPKSPDPRIIVWPIRLTESEAWLINRRVKKAKANRGEWMREELLQAATA